MCAAFRGCVLPVTDETNQDLTDHNTSDFQVSQCTDPVLIACFVILPALGESVSQEGRDGADGEQDVTVEC